MLRRLWKGAIHFLYRFNARTHAALFRLRLVQPWMLLAAVGFIVYAFVYQAPWPYALSAESGVVTLVPDGNAPTHWDVSGATICVRGPTDPLREQPTKGACPGSRWTSLATADEQERILTLRPSMAPARTQVRLESRPEGGVNLHLRSPPGGMVLESAQAAPSSMPPEALIMFPATMANEWPRELTFPFSGGIVIGDDARTGSSAMLREGSLTIYTRADDSISGRGLVDSVPLLPGDRLEISMKATSAEGYSKGFVQAVLAAPSSGQQMPGLRAMAFGHVEDVQIVRFGEQSQAFRPGLWTRLSRHSVVGTWLAALLGMLGLMAVFRDASEIGVAPAPRGTRSQD